MKAADLPLFRLPDGTEIRYDDNPSFYEQSVRDFANVVIAMRLLRNTTSWNRQGDFVKEVRAAIQASITGHFVIVPAELGPVYKAFMDQLLPPIDPTWSPGHLPAVVKRPWQQVEIE